MTKFCPTCQTRYDEDIVRFCTKDGTPLVPEEEPKFTSLPSQDSLPDVGEETLIRVPRPRTSTSTGSELSFESLREDSNQRILIPTFQQKRESTLPKSTFPPPAQKNSGALKFVALGCFGTFAVIAGAFGVWWLLQGRTSPAANANSNANVNTNTNANILLGSNTLDNSFSNFNFNSNVNANLKSPTPKPSKSPTPKPSPSPDNSNIEINANVNANTVIVVNSNVATPARTPTPTPTAPKPSPTEPPSNQPVNGGILNSRAIRLPKPAYPPIARQMNASGQVSVQVLVDEEGNVISAKAVNGHALLRAPAEAAARQSKFNPVTKDGRAVKAVGVIVYNFIKPE